jgi:hypothetical protein
LGHVDDALLWLVEGFEVVADSAASQVCPDCGWPILRGILIELQEVLQSELIILIIVIPIEDTDNPILIILESPIAQTDHNKLIAIILTHKPISRKPRKYTLKSLDRLGTQLPINNQFLRTGLIIGPLGDLQGLIRLNIQLLNQPAIEYILQLLLLGYFELLPGHRQSACEFAPQLEEIAV